MNNFLSLPLLKQLLMFALSLNCAANSLSRRLSDSLLCGLTFRKPFGLQSCWIICKHSERRQWLHEAEGMLLNANKANVMTGTQSQHSLWPFRYKLIYFGTISNRKLWCNFSCQYIIYFVINNDPHLALFPWCSPAHSLSSTHSACSKSLQSFLFSRLFSSLSLVMTEENIMGLKGTFYLCKET